MPLPSRDPATSNNGSILPHFVGSMIGLGLRSSTQEQRSDLVEVLDRAFQILAAEECDLVLDGFDSSQHLLPNQEPKARGERSSSSDSRSSRSESLESIEVLATNCPSIADQEAVLLHQELGLPDDKGERRRLNGPFVQHLASHTRSRTKIKQQSCVSSRWKKKH
jgi:hypothetical protein